MSGVSNIEWTEVTWNPTTGCSKISSGCKYCYAETWAKMQQERGITQYAEGFKFKLAPERLKDPLAWKKPKMIFVNSMSDLFYEQMPQKYLQQLFEVMASTPQHVYQILTKRIDNVLRLTEQLYWPDNIWLGVTVEENKCKSRIDELRKVPAKTKFISFEPLLEYISDIDLREIDWVIVGGESGGKARPIEKDWVLELLRVSRKESIPFFFKQWGKREFNPDQADPTLSKANSNHAKGGCMIDRKIYRTLPK